MERLRTAGSGIIFINFFLVLTAFAQEEQKTIEAVEHFRNNELYREGLSFISNSVAYGYPSLSNDSKSYFIGKFNYYLGNTNESIEAFQKVSENSLYFKESILFGSYELFYDRRLAEGRDLLQRRSFDYPSLEEESRRFLLAGESLLRRDISGYEAYRDSFDKQYRQLSSSQMALEKLKDDIVGIKRKSPFLAGIMSAIIPGSGQMYAGSPGQGAVSLITVGLMGIQAYESYRLDGFKSVRFGIFGALFTGFYLSNIYGGVLSVRLKTLEINDQIDESLLVTMHVPLRYIFD